MKNAARGMVWWTVLACSGGGDTATVPVDGSPDGGLEETGEPADTAILPTDSTTDTGPTDTGTPPPGATASCVTTVNPLVMDCTATLPVAGPATLELSAKGHPTRTFVSSEELTDHALLGWGLHAQTTYDWSFAGVTGTVTTGSLPPDLIDDLDVTVSGTLFGIDAVFVYVNCGYFAMIDGDGEIIWAMPTDTYDSLSDGMMWSQADRRILAVKDSTMAFGNVKSEFAEHDLLGNELIRMVEGVDYTLKMTHDVGRWQHYTYLLGEGNRIGGFEVYDGATGLGTYLLSDSFPSTNLGTAHVNGLSVSDVGEVIISVYGFDDIVAVDGDPASPTFLQMNWHAAGEPGGNDDLPSPDYVPPKGDLFVKQHNASRHGDDLWVFDNQSKPDSRALRMEMDHVSGEIRETGSWSVGQTCFNQGGAMPIDGGVLATCANSGDVYAFLEASTAPDWSMNAECSPFGFLAVSTRAFPVIVE